MNNARKRKLSLSKRHIRRIIADQSNIDIAGCSEQSSKETHIIHTSVEDSCSSDSVPEIINKENHTFCINSSIVNVDNEILCSNNEYTNYYEQYETNVTQRDSDHNLYNVTTNNIIAILTAVIKKNSKTL